MSLDVFLTSFRGGTEVPVDRNALDAALAAQGLAGEQTSVRTNDGGDALLLVDTDGASFLIESLTPQLSQVLFDVARDARLTVLPADGTPRAFVVDGNLVPGLPDDLHSQVLAASATLHAALQASLQARAARTP